MPDSVARPVYLFFICGCIICEILKKCKVGVVELTIKDVMMDSVDCA